MKKKRILLIKYLNCYEITVSIFDCITFKNCYKDCNIALKEANEFRKKLNVKIEYIEIKREVNLMGLIPID